MIKNIKDKIKDIISLIRQYKTPDEVVSFIKTFYTNESMPKNLKRNWRQKYIKYLFFAIIYTILIVVELKKDIMMFIIYFLLLLIILFIVIYKNAKAFQNDRENTKTNIKYINDELANNNFLTHDRLEGLKTSLMKKLNEKQSLNNTLTGSVAVVATLIAQAILLNFNILDIALIIFSITLMILSYRIFIPSNEEYKIQTILELINKMQLQKEFV